LHAGASDDASAAADSLALLEFCLAYQPLDDEEMEQQAGTSSATSATRQLCSSSAADNVHEPCAAQGAAMVGDAEDDRSSTASEGCVGTVVDFACLAAAAEQTGQQSAGGPVPSSAATPAEAAQDPVAVVTAGASRQTAAAASEFACRAEQLLAQLEAAERQQEQQAEPAAITQASQAVAMVLPSATGTVVCYPAEVRPPQV
jgi:hypothetical protein